MLDILRSLLIIGLCGLAKTSVAQSLSADLIGTWDITTEECDAPGTSFSQIDISTDQIRTYGGKALIVEVEKTGPVTFVAADYLQLEGVENPSEERAERAYFRLTQRDGPDRLNLVWKDVQTIDLVRCGDTGLGQDGGAVSDEFLPINTGLWVMDGVGCDQPANAFWHIYDGRGLKGSQSRHCEITDVSNEGSRYAIQQTCIATYDGSKETFRDIINIETPRRFGMIEDGEQVMQIFNWCGPQLEP